MDVSTHFEIGNREANLDKLIRIISVLLGNELTRLGLDNARNPDIYPGKGNIFTSTPHHLLRNMFLDLEDGTKGIRNATCVRISNSGGKTTMMVVHSEESGRDKPSYKYLEKNAPINPA